MSYANLVTRNWESYRAQAKPPGRRRVSQGLVCRGEAGQWSSSVFGRRQQGCKWLRSSVSGNLNRAKLRSHSFVPRRCGTSPAGSMVKSAELRIAVSGPAGEYTVRIRTGSQPTLNVEW